MIPEITNRGERADMYGISGRRREEKEGEKEDLSSYAVYPAGSLINQAPPTPTRNQHLIYTLLSISTL